MPFIIETTIKHLRSLKIYLGQTIPCTKYSHLMAMSLSSKNRATLSFYSDFVSRSKKIGNSLSMR